MFIPLNYVDTEKWLARYKILSAEIEYNAARIEALRERASSPRTPKLDGMPHSPSGSGQTFDDTMNKYLDIEREIHEKDGEASQLYRDIDKAINQLNGLRNPDISFVLKARYLDCFEWSDILDLLFLKKDDYLQKEDSYRRRMFKLRQTGVRRLSERFGEKERKEVEQFYSNRTEAEE